MGIKYAGPKVIFSQSGIRFDTHKEDKYVYLNIATQLCEALSHEHTPNHTYAYDATSKRLSDAEIIAHIDTIVEDKEALFQKAQMAAFLYVEHEQEHARTACLHTGEVNYATWLANIELMKEYIVQRHFNKQIYYALINTLAKQVLQHRITEINTPMFEKFVHVLHSLQGVLQEGKRAISSHVEFYKKEDTLMVRLCIHL
ncbi:MAG: hypothetical protein IBX45_06750 [Campylobacterales bacterium]|nr:hypothetical protein [Campylobacterales bacterium]